MGKFFWSLFEGLVIGVVVLVAVGFFHYYTSVTTIKATLDGEPIASVVKVDGKRVGRTPYSARWFFESHTVEIIQPGYLETVEEKYSISLGVLRFGNTNQTCDFHSSYLILEVTAALDGAALQGATVEVDGQIVGRTPYTSERLQHGHHQITVTPPKRVRTAEESLIIDMDTQTGAVRQGITANFHKP